MRKFTLAFSRNGSIIPDVPEISDLVALGILPKPISEFTNDDIGTIINIPYNDESGKISGPIEFEVVGVNHHKDINIKQPTGSNTLIFCAYICRHQSTKYCNKSHNCTNYNCVKKLFHKTNVFISVTYLYLKSKLCKCSIKILPNPFFRQAKQIHSEIKPTFKRR